LVAVSRLTCVVTGLPGREVWQLGQWRGAEERVKREKKAGRMAGRLRKKVKAWRNLFCVSARMKETREGRGEEGEQTC
jgi:hypothetical protein